MQIVYWMMLFFVELSPTHLDEHVAGLQKHYFWFIALEHPEPGP